MRIRFSIFDRSPKVQFDSARRFIAGTLRWLCISIAIGFLLGLVGISRVLALGPTNTPLPVSIPTLTPTPTPRQVLVTPTPTPTSAQWVIEARSQDGGANVRLRPDIDSPILDKIFPGQFFVVVARYGKWIEIKFEKADTGYAWVFEDVIKITGSANPLLIPTAQPGALPSPNPLIEGLTLTADFLTRTPGAPETATALQASATGIFGPLSAGPTDTLGPTTPLPTFTDPPLLVEATLPSRTNTATSQSGLPPVVPIIALAIIGVVGLIISALRRL